jgi:hypothetical protein
VTEAVVSLNAAIAAVYDELSLCTERFVSREFLCLCLSAMRRELLAAFLNGPLIARGNDVQADSCHHILPLEQTSPSCSGCRMCNRIATPGIELKRWGAGVGTGDLNNQNSTLRTYIGEGVTGSG